MKKKFKIGLIVIAILLLTFYILLTYTNITKGLAMSTAQQELEQNYPKFGTPLKEDIGHFMIEYTAFPICKFRGYSIAFTNKNNDIVVIEVSSYFPFVVTNSWEVSA